MSTNTKSRARRAFARNGNDHQPDLFGDRPGQLPTGTPTWSDLPRETQGTLTRLMVRLILEHGFHRGDRAQQEGGHDL
ncbi:MAG: hypothetical protein ACT6Q8_25155 [Niveispirillum sp.]|uniref:hypothetical protein n=1 Tax=Niveispirillum sp. TaxID=1917217 RepID=UPI004035539F